MDRILTVAAGAFLLLAADSAVAQAQTAPKGYDHPPIKTGAYLCLEEASGGVRFDSASKRWVATTFNPSARYIVRFKFERTHTQALTPTFARTFHEYRVSITKAGEKDNRDCFDSGKHDATLPLTAVAELDALECSTGYRDYKFDFGAGRFATTASSGFLNHVGREDATADIAVGTCTRISD